jgi:hypothetical protein
MSTVSSNTSLSNDGNVVINGATSSNNNSSNNKLNNKEDASTKIPTTPTKHWSLKKHETVLPSNLIDTNDFLLSLDGGSDNGQFIFINDKIQKSFKIQPNEIILEINGQKVNFNL